MNFESYVIQIKKIYQEANKEMTLHDGATNSELKSIEQETGFELDASLKQCWQKNNGAPQGAVIFARKDFLTGYGFNSTQASIQEMRAMKNRSASYPALPIVDQRIQSCSFVDGWIPFASFGGGSLTLISDLSPSDKGSRGQVIGYVHDPDEIVFIADSFEEFLRLSLEAFKYDYEEYLDLY